MLWKLILIIDVYEFIDNICFFPRRFVSTEYNFYSLVNTVSHHSGNNCESLVTRHKWKYEVNNIEEIGGSDLLKFNGFLRFMVNNGTVECIDGGMV